jgi:hypothetical protein
MVASSQTVASALASPSQVIAGHEATGLAAAGQEQVAAGHEGRVSFHAPSEPGR